MASLGDIMGRVSTVVAGITPDTSPSVGFVAIGRDLSAEQEPDTGHRRFEVRPVTGSTLSRMFAGSTTLQMEAQFEIVVVYDLDADRDTGLRDTLNEDAERIAYTVEMDTGMPSGTREVQLVSSRVEGEGHFYTLILTYRALFERTF